MCICIYRFLYRDNTRAFYPSNGASLSERTGESLVPFSRLSDRVFASLQSSLLVLIISGAARNPPRKSTSKWSSPVQVVVMGESVVHCERALRDQHGPDERDRAPIHRLNIRVKI